MGFVTGYYKSRFLYSYNRMTTLTLQEGNLFILRYFRTVTLIRPTLHPLTVTTKTKRNSYLGKTVRTTCVCVVRLPSNDDMSSRT